MVAERCLKTVLSHNAKTPGLIPRTKCEGCSAQRQSSQNLNHRGAGHGSASSLNRANAGTEVFEKQHLRVADRSCLPSCVLKTDYSADWMALSSRKRKVLSSLLSAITKRTRPCWDVSA